MDFKWINFYMELADKLLTFKNDRAKLIKKINKVYEIADIKVPKLEKDYNIIDIDPFTFFALFNKGITHSNRLKLVNAISDVFEINSETPKKFDGVPVLINLNSTFYQFKDIRGKDDIDNLWNLFESAIRFSDDYNEENLSSFCKYFDKVKDQGGIKWNITIGLFWIRPYFYINLDSRNRWYLLDEISFPNELVSYLSKEFKKMPGAHTYVAINDKIKNTVVSGNYQFDNLPKLSYRAWIRSEEVNKEKKGKDGQIKLLNSAFMRWFNPLIVALRDLGGSASPVEVRQKIIENENLSDEEISRVRGKNKVNKFENEVAFARSYLVKAGYLDNSERGIWSLSNDGGKIVISDELASEIVRKFNSNKDNKNALADENVNTISYWTYSPGPGARKWDFCVDNEVMVLGWGEIGDLSTYISKKEIKNQMIDTYGDTSSYMNSSHACWQFVHDVKVGDIIFAKTGTNKIIGRGVVKSDYNYYEDASDEYVNLREVNWTDKGLWEIENQFAQKTLTDITPYNEFVQEINDIFEDEDDVKDKVQMNIPQYTHKNFLEDVYMSEREYNQLVNVLKKKKNVILQGPPGVGKTYISKRLAYSIMGCKDVERVMMVQFHQSYSYEDFIMGYRPSNDGFEIKKGSFYNFCKKAEIDSDNDYFFIVDEINRGNLSKIFGEIFMLIENDKRGIGLQLVYSDEKFSVPENLYIIGMMNTADRSLAMLDYALRRRFAFFEIRPGFETSGFKKYQKEVNNYKFDELIDVIKNLNYEIANDSSLGKGFSIGHSYFTNFNQNEFSIEDLYSIIEFEIIPLLEEYWFDEIHLVDKWTKVLRESLSDSN